MIFESKYNDLKKDVKCSLQTDECRYIFHRPKAYDRNCIYDKQSVYVYTYINHKKNTKCNKIVWQMV